jgi:tagatose 1,6-diphosphate aldolase
MATSVATKRKLSLGKVGGLRRLSDSRGIFYITAMDQRNSMRGLVDAAHPDQVTPAQLSDIKMALAAALSPHSTAVLLDPQYGVAQAVSSGALNAHVGLIVTLEADRPRRVGQGIITQIAPGLSAGKIQRMGGDAVKLLVRYRPDLPDAAVENRAVIEEVSEQCRAFDIPFVLEPTAYALDGESKEDLARKKPSLVVQTAKELSRYCDLYKAEFPDDLTYEKDEAALNQHCQELNDASVVPWVILSAGADMGPFSKMVEVACQNGASGFLAGRAIWKNFVAIPDGSTRQAMLESKAVPNLGLLTAIAKRDARPWTEHPGIEIPAPSSFATDWYESYANDDADTSGATGTKAGTVSLTDPASY